jgi:hypothetical protein
VSPRPGTAAGVVKIRLSGDPADSALLAAIIGASPAVEVIEQSAPYPSRRDPGERTYLTVRVDRPGGAS